MDVAVEHDVLVLGAGPGGTAAAIRLAEMGHDVGIVERQRFPREHVGICVSAATPELIDYLGVGQEFDAARFWRRNVTAVRWEKTETQLVAQPGYHVDRGVLDELLLRRARSVGVKVYQPARIEDMARSPSDGWHVWVALPERQLLKACVIVDAAGRRAAIRGPRVKDGPPLLALHASWSIAKAPAFDGLIEAGENAWLWYAQTARNRAMVSVFCDPRHLAPRTGPQDWYVELLRQFTALELEELGQQCTSTHACDATSQHADDPIGEGYVRVGDACLSVDPLSSQGVHLALQSGLQGAVVVNTLLRKAENAEAGREFFRLRAGERVSRHRERTRSEYARVSAIRSNAFWQERAVGPMADVSELQQLATLAVCKPADHVALSPDVRFEAAPVIEGNFVEVRRVVNHPGIAGSIAFLEGVELAPLLTRLPPSAPYSEIPTLWRDFVSLETASKIALWLWDRRLLIRTSWSGKD